MKGKLEPGAAALAAFVALGLAAGAQASGAVVAHRAATENVVARLAAGDLPPTTAVGRQASDAAAPAPAQTRGSGLVPAAPIASSGPTAPSAASAPAPSSSPMCTVWTLPPHSQPPLPLGVLGHPVVLPLAQPAPMSATTELAKGTAGVDGSVLVMRVYVVDLDEQLPPHATGLSWRATWSYAGTAYAAWATYTEDGAVSFQLDAASGVAGTGLQGPSLPTAVSGHIVTGPGGYAEIDVPLALAGDPGHGAVLTGVGGQSFADFGAGPELSAVELGVDSGGGEGTYTLGGC